MSLYFDREGRPITVNQWRAVFEAGARSVGRDDVGDVMISTVWLGLDMQFGVGPPLIFETMIFGGDHNGSQWRYSSEDEARVGHAFAVLLVEGLGQS